MKNYYAITVLLFSSLTLTAQKIEEKAIHWMNNNSIKIEDAKPNTALVIFKNKVPEKFINARIFGFGEASHRGKEFFNLKAKFFKYLVKNKDVKVFIMEESFPAEAGINEWISGGKGDIHKIANNFSMYIWYSKEIVNLLKWMRDYNSDKLKENQIRFYGMDIQNVKNINVHIRDLILKYQIDINEELLITLDNCANKKVNDTNKKDWADNQIPKLKKINQILLAYQNESKLMNKKDFEFVIRALNYLTAYTYYVQNNYSQIRDLKMYENVQWIVENKSKNGKAFIWAHNEHINNYGFGNYSKRNIYNLGRYLKEHYKNDYYSVGFDFGIGILPGVSVENGKSKWKNYKLDEPYPKTYAKTFFNVNDSIFFIDMAAALKSNVKKFFDKKKKQLNLGGPGYNPKNYYLFDKKYSEMFDGLIFIKNISPANYKLN